MRKKIMAFVFAAALVMALAVPLFGGGGTALAVGPPATLPGEAQVPASVPVADGPGDPGAAGVAIAGVASDGVVP